MLHQRHVLNSISEILQLISSVPEPAAPQTKHRLGFQISSEIPQTRTFSCSPCSDLFLLFLGVTMLPARADAITATSQHWTLGMSLPAQRFGWLPPASRHHALKSSWKNPSWCFPLGQQLTGGGLPFTIPGFSAFPTHNSARSLLPFPSFSYQP